MPGSNNFLQWNPAINNQETDAQYLADTMRLNGAVSGIYTAPLHNKFAYQMSTFVKALGDSLANQGYTVSDSNLANLVAVFATLANTAGFNMTGAINESMGTSIASAATTNIATATGNFVQITGTTTITSFGTAPAGAERTLQFTGAVTITYNATSLMLPGATNLVTSAGDVLKFRSLGSGNWLCVGYEPIGAFSMQSQKIVNLLAGVNSGDAVNMGQFSSSLAVSGWQKLPSGEIEQWGISAIQGNGTSPVTINLPTTYPTAHYVTIPTAVCQAGGTGVKGVNVKDWTTSTLTFNVANITGTEQFYIFYISKGK